MPGLTERGTEQMKHLAIVYILFPALFLPVSGTAGGAQPDIADFLKQDSKTVWTVSPGDFCKKNGSEKLYRWNSVRRRSLHYAVNAGKGALYFLDWQITEADFYFDANRLSCICLNIYNKSCSTNQQLAAGKNTFLKFLDTLHEALTKFCRTDAGKISTTLINGARCQSCVWNSPAAYIVLKWSYDGTGQYNFAAHYVTIYLYRDEAAFHEKSRSRIAGAEEQELKCRVKTNADGDRYLELPMVDQGQRGYCVVACAERILRYYQVNVDQHVLAEAANTTKNGTLTAEIERSMRSIGTRCRFHVKEISEYTPVTGQFKIINFVKKYNRYAWRAGKKKINVYKVKTYNQLFSLMDEDILVKTRLNYDKNGFRKFQQGVKQAVDAGLPVLWSVLLGMIKEGRLPQNVGGHMRLIIGYNPGANEVIYSDSWGKGHEFKKMSWDKAWAMTEMAHVFIPKKY
ncbi:MAG: C39 family peptidase [Victivallaceae bacterium]|nr:C39 family peptidase [Victivallaceae bacterium]